MRATNAVKRRCASRTAPRKGVRRVARFAEVARGRVIRFGTAPPAEFRADAIEERGLDGSSFDFIAPEGRARLDCR